MNFTISIIGYIIYIQVCELFDFQEFRCSGMVVLLTVQTICREIGRKELIDMQFLASYHMVNQDDYHYN